MCKDLDVMWVLNKVVILKDFWRRIFLFKGFIDIERIEIVLYGFLMVIFLVIVFNFCF